MATIRSFAATPAKRWGMFGRSLVLPMAATWALLFGFSLARLDVGPWVYAAVFVVVATFELTNAAVPLAHRRVLRTLRSLHRQLPWFEPDLVAWIPSEREATLRAALAETGAVVHDVDHAAIRASGGLQRPLDAMTTSLPKDGKVHAFVCAHADALAQHDPALLHRFVSEWRLRNPTRALLFFLAPAAAAVEPAPRLAVATA